MALFTLLPQPFSFQDALDEIGATGREANCTKFQPRSKLECSLPPKPGRPSTRRQLYPCSPARSAKYSRLGPQAVTLSFDLYSILIPTETVKRSTRSNPVPERQEWDPIHAEESLTAAFAGTAVSGQWTLRLRDTTAKELTTGIGKAANRNAHGDGGVAGWEVIARV